MSSQLIVDAVEFAALTEQRKRLKRDIEALQEQLDAIEERLSESFIQNGLGNMTVRGVVVHSYRQIFPALIVPEGFTRDEARDRAVRALEDMGHRRLVTYNGQSMRALVKDLMDDDGALPPPLGDWVRAEIRHRIGVRKAGERRR